MLVQPASFDDGYDVGGSEITRAGKECARITIPVVHRPTEGLRICRSHTFLAGTRSLSSDATNYRGIPPIARWN